MLSKISAFFQSLGESADNQKQEISLEIACSVLLCEVMLADGQLDSTEQEQLNKILAKQFLLSAEEIEEIIKRADKALYKAKKTGKNKIEILRDAAFMSILNG